MRHGKIPSIQTQYVAMTVKPWYISGIVCRNLNLDGSF